jgi:hypothetical protein
VIHSLKDQDKYMIQQEVLRRNNHLLSCDTTLTAYKMKTKKSWGGDSQIERQ